MITKLTRTKLLGWLQRHGYKNRVIAIKTGVKYTPRLDILHEVAAIFLQAWWRKTSKGRRHLTSITNQEDPMTLEVPRGVLFYTVSEYAVFRFEPIALIDYLTRTESFRNPYTNQIFNACELRRLIRLYNVSRPPPILFTLEMLESRRQSVRIKRQSRETINFLISSFREHYLAGNFNLIHALSQQILQIDPLYGSRAIAQALHISSQ